MECMLDRQEWEILTTGREIIVLLLPALIIIIRGITRVLAVFGILCDGRMIK